MDGTCNDAELEELFRLIQEGGDFGEIKEILRETWTSEEDSEKLPSLHWEDLQTLMEQRRPKSEVRSLPRRALIYRISVAAGFLLLLGVAGWFWMQREVVTIYETGYGEVKEFVLNDNSKIRLNANTKLIWDENWKRRGGRIAKVEGEAFFEVTHLEDDRSFHVVTPDLTVKVTGTAFNVTTRSEKTRVYLESGEVYLDLNRPESSEKEGIDPKFLAPIKMLPGELVDYSKTTREINQKSNMSAQSAASWKDGELVFEDVPLSEVLRELGQVYGKNFTVRDSSLFHKKIDVGMPYSDWETVKGLMQLMINVKMTESEGEVVIE